MKKHITPLSALALVIGGLVIFAGCGPSEDPDAIGEGEPATRMSDEDRKAADKFGIELEPKTDGKENK